ncbi:MAG TPA: T3SS effector HopA1 family protein, partial [Thermomicrobiaceae bacterium]|nr:T3SS effector HopA1 family protein [Thermomicrobiaceae bacterium]
MDRYRQQLESLIGALRVVPPDRFRWFGAWSPQPPRSVRARVDAATRHAYLVAQVRSHLYRQFYLPGQVVPLASPAAASPAPDEDPFVRALIEANRGTGSWQPGWTLVERSGDVMQASRAGLTVWARTADCRVDQASPASVAVRLPKGSRSQSPGFYLAQGDEPFTLLGDDALVRLYWHLTPAAAIALMSSVTATLNAARIPFQFKVLKDPSAYTRNDAGVLYLSRGDLRRSARLLERIYRDVQNELLPGEPALTKRLAPGLGLAEDPGDGDSFGMHRCRLLAEAFVEAAGQRVRDPAGVLGLIEERFARDGLDPARPYLGPGAADDYDGLLKLASRPARRRPAAVPHSNRETESVREDDAARRTRYLAAARQIGDRLAADAVWYDGRCTWLGKLGQAPDASDAGATFGALSPDLYAGTAGIALFLAQLFAETGDERYAGTARGAMDQAVRRVEQKPEEATLGLYSGWPGIALAAARVGRLVGDDALARDTPRRLCDALMP